MVAPSGERNGIGLVVGRFHTASVRVKRSHGVIDSQYFGLDAQKTKAVRQLTLQYYLADALARTDGRQ